MFRFSVADESIQWTKYKIVNKNTKLLLIQQCKRTEKLQYNDDVLS